MANPGDFRNSVRDRLISALGGGGGNKRKQATPVITPARTPSTAGITPAAFGGAAATKAGNNNKGGGGNNKQPGKVGQTCTSNKDCGQNTTCQNGTCVAKQGGGGGGGGGKQPGNVGQTCTNDRDCGQNTSCENGTCVQKGGGGGGGGGVDDGKCNPPCGPNEKCRRKRCVPINTPDPTDPPDGGDDGGGDDGGGGSGTCLDNRDCNFGETCVSNRCVTPSANPNTVDNAIAENPTNYLFNLANKGQLRTEGGTSFGNFLAQRAIPNMLQAYDAEAITNPNLQFKTWLANNARYGNPNLRMTPDGQVSAPGIDDDNVLGTQGRKQKEDSNQSCDGNDQCPPGERCKNGTCKANECQSTADCGGGKTCVDGTCQNYDNQSYIPTYNDGVTTLANYWRDLYYKASATDRGSNPSVYGGGSTRWSAF